MAARYQETTPQSLPKDRVECVWTSEAGHGDGFHRVLPDGCIDVMYTRENGKSRLDIIGAMTRYQDVVAEPGTRITAIRFHPGGVSGIALPGCAEWTDREVELAVISPRDARYIRQRMDEDPSPQNMETLMAGMVRALPGPDAVQRALIHLTESGGRADLAWLADQSNLSDRQFRRLCLARTGLRPKQLARILRFRRAYALCRNHGLMSLTDIAMECDYFDQSHFIHDFQEWCGQTPSAVRARHGVQPEAAG